jgi:hypothetical protein
LPIRVVPKTPIPDVPSCCPPKSYSKKQYT